jgi:excisionase family DNA binding protein
MQEVSDQLGVSYKTVQRWIKSGKVPAQKVNGIYQIRVDIDRAKNELKRFSKSRTEENNNGQDGKRSSNGQSNSMSKEDILLKELERANRRIDDLTGLLRDKETKEHDLIALNTQLTRQVLLQSGQETGQPTPNVHNVQPEQPLTDSKDITRDSDKTGLMSILNKNVSSIILITVIIAIVIFGYYIFRIKGLI